VDVEGMDGLLLGTLRDNTPWERWQVRHGGSIPTVYVLSKVHFLGTYVPSTEPARRAPAVLPQKFIRSLRTYVETYQRSSDST
jgi:hypothetical protein